MKKDRFTDPAEIKELASSFKESRVFLTAYDLGIFTIIEGGGKTAEEISAAVNGNTGAVERFMNALAAMGMVKKEDDKFINCKAASEYLVEGKSDYMFGLKHTVHLWDTWDHLTESVLTGEPKKRKPINERGADWLHAFIDAMHMRGVPQAKQLMPMVDFSGVKKMLDVGGGSGIFSSMFVKENPGLESVVFDLPNVIPITKDYLEEEGVTDRVSTKVGDYMINDFGAGYDLIFLSAIVHINSYEENKELIAKCADSLNENGQIVIFDHVMSDPKTEPYKGALFSINMLVSTDKGSTYSKKEISEWFTAAGMSDIKLKESDEGHQLMMARKI